MKTLINPGIIVSTVTLLASYLALSGCAQQKMQRYGSVIGLKSEKIEEYKRLHADVWPDVLKMIEQCNIHNYSIYLGELEQGNYYLFSYFEYVGDDFETDMKNMADDPETQRWWALMGPMQDPLPDRAEGEWWAEMDEVFHAD